jgi:ABC-2 type transport system permease protein
MSLTATRTTGWATGFGNMLHKELGSWWRTRRWLVHLVLWQVVISGLILLISLEQRGETSTPEAAVNEVMQVFFQAGGFFSLLGAVLVSQGAIVGERRSGTAAWVLTKPTTRQSFVLAKLAAITGSFLLLAIAVPAIVVLVICQLVFAHIPALIHYTEAVGILALHHTFYIAIALTFGTFFRARGPVAGAALGFWLSGQIIPNFAPRWLSLGLPWPLAPAAASIAVWKPVPMPLWLPVAATAVLTLVAIVVALWRFDREEF